MDIWPQDNNFFAWRFNEFELKLPEHKDFVEKVKAEFAHKTERMYFREENKWLIHKSQFIDFMDLYCQFVDSYVNNQRGLNLDG